MSEVVKVTANIPASDVATLAEMAEKHRSTKTSALVRAIRTTAFLEEQVDAGSRVIVESSDGERREIVFK